MQVQEDTREVPSATADSAAVSELIGDIDAELRLHQMRVQEFLDGTNEFAAITSSPERVRLLRIAQALSSTISDLSDLG